jgi:hypothetical protein
MVPSTEQARSALSAALQAWQEGHLGHSIAATNPQVEVVDTYRKLGRPLRKFEILGAVEAERFRCFAVRLSIDDPPEEQVVRYVVFGKVPIWIFRQEDLERTSHWEHKMEETDPAAPQSAGPAPPPGG